MDEWECKAKDSIDSLISRMNTLEAHVTEKEVEIDALQEKVYPVVLMILVTNLSGQSRLLHTMTKESTRPGKCLCDEFCPGSASPRFCVTARGQEEGGR